MFYYAVSYSELFPLLEFEIFKYLNLEKSVLKSVGIVYPFEPCEQLKPNKTFYLLKYF